jgi:hypothetical protein
MEINRFNIEGKQQGDYVYRIRNTGESSAKLGNCERCQKPASEVFHQVEGKLFDNFGALAVTYHDTTSLFGHADCLTSSRR